MVYRAAAAAAAAARMGDGTVAGLRTGEDVSAELRAAREEQRARFMNLDAEVTGRNASTVYRDKKGQRVDPEVLAGEKAAASRKPEPKAPVWGKGLKQQRDALELRDAEQAEVGKPFASYRDDPDRDREMRQALRWGDPMAHLVKNKPAEAVLPDLGEHLRDSGFAVPQEVPDHSWIKRRISPAPNRFGIKPGRHWDGVDRSNGFETGMFKSKNERQALEKEAYMWSVSDM